MLTPGQIQRVILDTLDMRGEAMAEKDLQYTAYLHGVMPDDFRQAMRALVDNELVRVGDGKVRKV